MQTKKQHNASSRKYRQVHPEREVERSRKYYISHLDQVRVAVREQSLQRKFGITPEQYNEMLADQLWGCAICGKSEVVKSNVGNIKRLAIDHDHKTGKIRGLLCSNCNVAIGLMNDSKKIVRFAEEYLERS